MAVEHVEQLTLQRGPRQHPIEEIRSIERADELERIVQGELDGDVPADARGSRRRECVKADAG